MHCIQCIIFNFCILFIDLNLKLRKLIRKFVKKMSPYICVLYSNLQVDQLFSILCRVLKSEIQCPDDLIKKIKQAPIIPKPDVDELLFTWNWRDFITPKLSGKSLQNHSFFHSFQLKKENGIAVFRAKKYTQMSEWGPDEGIKLLKDGFEDFPVQASEFRVESLNLDKVYSDLYSKYFPTLTIQDRKDAEVSWENLRTVLENLPKKRINLPPLRLSSLPRQNPVATARVPEYLEPCLNEDVHELIGEHCILEPSEGQFDIDILPLMDVAVYTQSVKDRPWLGRVQNVEENGAKFEIQWYKKKGRTMTFQAMLNKDGSRMTSVLPSETVMLWEFSTNRTDNTFDISKEYLDKIQKEYADHDRCYV